MDGPTTPEIGYLTTDDPTVLCPTLGDTLRVCLQSSHDTTSSKCMTLIDPRISLFSSTLGTWMVRLFSVLR